ncbi:peptide chain release factor N(5)-glutamine methyltransferase [Halothiobacillus sp. DCM-1]|uniref:peptide chain release factor N(5)-glutamine methyltransferase n=1 Tax=Halothiobacillus sp. DCM-1 TaxID=3112558 RepID=UPI0032451A3C
MGVPNIPAAEVSLIMLWTEGVQRLGSDESAQIDVRALIEGITGLSRSQCWLNPQQPIPQAQVEALRSAFAARAQGQPVAYILGYRDFWRHRFLVTADTLIPRAETEHLVEWACALLPPQQPALVVDLGTGTGAIALSVLLERPSITMLAIDRNAATLTVARANAERLLPSPLQAQWLALQGDWASALATASVDLLLANPPYLRADDPHQQQGDLRFEPASALLAGTDGLRDIQHIIQQARRVLRPGGGLLFEHGYNQGQAVRELLAVSGFVQIETRRDYSGHERNTLGFWPKHDEKIAQISPN